LSVAAHKGDQFSTHAEDFGSAMSQSPEAILEGKKRPFTGAEFLESLRDGREVYIYGERVGDVTTHPAFRNSVASVALLYDALHDPKTKDVLTAPTDTGSPGYTHKFFKAARSREEVVAQRDAIAAWARITYGWMGRSPDYKAAFLNTLGANAEFYGKFADNARAWHKRAQEAVLYLNHALVNPPIDRDKPVEQVKDVYITIQKETDAGIYVSGAKVVATNSALTHYNFLGQNMGQEITDPSMVVMFIAPMDTPGIKLICRPSYEFAAAATGSPWDYPLTSRFDENDAIFIFDNAFIPWENVVIHRDIERLKTFYPRSGFFNGFTMGFEPLPGTQGKLEAAGVPALQLPVAALVGGDEPFDDATHRPAIWLRASAHVPHQFGVQRPRLAAGVPTTFAPSIRILPLETS